jgi:hypothetical protein
MECEFCKSNFSSKSNLNYHQRNNKTCLNLQQKSSDKDIKIDLISCNFCNKSFSIPNLNKHIIICTNKKNKDKLKLEEIKKVHEQELQEIRKNHEQEISELMDEIQKLKEHIIKIEAENNILSKDRELVHKIASQPKTVQNGNKINMINNFVYDPEKIKEMVEKKLTKNHIIDGQKGVAHFAYNTILKDGEGKLNYFCTDPSRSVFKFQNTEGGVEKDLKASKLTDLILTSGLKDKTINLAMNLWTKEDGSIDSEKFRIFNPPANEIIMMNSDNTIFRNELACLTSS